MSYNGGAFEGFIYLSERLLIKINSIHAKTTEGNRYCMQYMPVSIHSTKDLYFPKSLHDVSVHNMPYSGGYMFHLCNHVLHFPN